MDSRSGEGFMSSREQFTVGLLKNSLQPLQNMRLAFGPDGTAVYKPVPSGSPTSQGAAVPGGVPGGGDGAAPVAAPHGISLNVGEPVKRKRGRPRKYGQDGTMILELNPVSTSPVGVAGSAGFSSPAVGAPLSSASSPSSSGVKKARGRTPGSGKKRQMAALGSAGFGFTPHIITVKAGEDVSSKIMPFSQHGSRAVCILSANGAISNVTLRQAATSGGTVTYEGRFEILSLSGSFLLLESGGQRSRTGGLSISLAGPDGRVLGGGVAGLLTAASPVQVVAGSFNVDAHKESKQASTSEPASAPVNLAPAATTGPGSPLNQSSGACNINQRGLSSMPWK